MRPFLTCGPLGYAWRIGDGCIARIAAAPALRRNQQCK
jgi:hypothetical protein